MTKAKESKADKAQADADKAQAEVDEVHAEIRRKWETYDRSEIRRTVATDDGELEVRTVDGKLYLTIDSHEAVLDGDGVIELRKQIEAAFQAVP